MQNINDYKESITTYSNEYEQIRYYTTNIQDVSVDNIIALDHKINRYDNILKLLQIMPDITEGKLNKIFEIEASVFEFTLVYANINKYEKIYEAIYNDKFNDILNNLDKNGPEFNPKFKELVYNNDFDARCVAFMTPQEIYPENWKNILEKFKYKDEKRKNMSVTDIYKCKRGCEVRRFCTYQLQTRSADEPITKFIVCLECYLVMRE
jgi:DNA-directed RNA polymerase subunit M/transcription elongation factor TFIIS